MTAVSSLSHSSSCRTHAGKACSKAWRFSWVRLGVSKKKKENNMKNPENEENGDDGTQRSRESLAR